MNSSDHVAAGPFAFADTQASAVAPLLASITGFYLAFRIVAVLLFVRLLDIEAQLGVAVSLAINFLLLAAALVVSPPQRRSRHLLSQPCLWAAALYLCLCGASLAWTAAESFPAAVAFWIAMFADAASVALLLQQLSPQPIINALLRGFIYGACAVAVVAWILPAESDLRLGDEELLGPNQIGWVCAFALWLAQYLHRSRQGTLRAEFVLLGLTLIRSLSKTTITATLAGGAYLFVRDRSMRRRSKVLLLACLLLCLLVFWPLLSSYYDVYVNAGNQAETLTGRVGIWAYILNEAFEHPWVGHGFHSVWKVIPPFGSFEARHAHNELLQQFYAYGLVGVLTVGLVYGSVYRQLCLCPDALLRTSFQSMLLFVIVRGFTDTEVFDLSLPMWFIVVLGTLLAQTRTAQHAHTPAQKESRPCE